MLTLWGRRSSFNVQKVMWLLHEIGLPHRHIEAGGAHGGLDTPAFGAMNPHRKVPVIDDDGHVVWESHAILRYIAARHGGARFWHDDARIRSQADRWIDWVATGLQPDLLNGVFWGFYRTPAPARDMVAVSAAIARTDARLAVLDGVLAGRAFLGGDAPGLADIAAGTGLYRWFTLDIPRAPAPHVEAWYARLQQRPAYRDGVMIPYAELFGRLDF
ncbi:glutathione S-transferase family protein [Roseomonas sp. CECT 9278]|uniref:glutathione S-transferase family protein n=1 Tax=Roseomonas sp. CECT 9278 TaxID=2845823 RepID=UPI001E348D18|nr:glutathione S-transferase family protein [Roseomonas sp. CECT 9278]CAH0218036.1 Glutathione S-transferase GstB [Roseomonas sp. CECT 9278]